MRYVNEQELKNHGFNELYNGMFVIIQAFGNELIDIVVAYRLNGINDTPMQGWMFCGFDTAEYFEDMDKAVKLFNLKEVINEN